MNIQIIGEHLTVTDAIHQYIENRFSHLPIPDKLQHVVFRLGNNRGIQYVHFTAHCAKEDIVIKTEDGDLYASIDKMMDKIHRSFIKTKEKHNVHLHKTQSVASYSTH